MSRVNSTRDHPCVTWDDTAVQSLAVAHRGVLRAHRPVGQDVVCVPLLNVYSDESPTSISLLG